MLSMMMVPAALQEKMSSGVEAATGVAEARRMESTGSKVDGRREVARDELSDQRHCPPGGDVPRPAEVGVHNGVLSDVQHSPHMSALLGQHPALVPSPQDASHHIRADPKLPLGSTR